MTTSGRQAGGAHGGRREADALGQQRDGEQQEEGDDGDAGEQVDVVQRPLRHDIAPFKFQEGHSPLRTGEDKEMLARTGCAKQIWVYQIAC